MNNFDSFWSRHLALFYGLSALLSFYFALNPSISIFFLLLLLSATSGKSLSRFLLRGGLFWGLNLSVILYCSLLYKLPYLQDNGVEGCMRFHISSVTPHEGRFGKQLIYHGIGKRFTSSSSSVEGKNFPCSIFISKKFSTPEANKDYLIQGILKKGAFGNYFFFPDKKIPWTPLQNTLSAASLRYQLKEKVKQFIKGHISNFRSAEFLSGIFTGQFEDKIMSAEFGKLGLLHLMAISGFHFALISGVFAFLLRLVLPPKLTTAFLIFLLSAYFLFLGDTPSVTRAWSMHILLLAALMGERRPAALNSLGFSFLFILLFDPLLIKTMGFQFSAAVTASILIFYPHFRTFLRRFILKRPLFSLLKMSKFDQHCYCILAALREALALAIAVNVIATPLTLFYFNKLPLMSFVYNLFIPFLVSISLFFLILASFFYILLPPIGEMIFSFTSTFTHFLLNFVYNAPMPMNVYWVVQEIPSSLLIIYLVVLFGLGIRLSKFQKKSIDFYFS